MAPPQNLAFGPAAHDPACGRHCTRSGIVPGLYATWAPHGAGFFAPTTARAQLALSPNWSYTWSDSGRNRYPADSKKVFAAFVTSAPHARTTSTSSRVKNSEPRCSRQAPNVYGANAAIFFFNPSGSASEPSVLTSSFSPKPVVCPGQASRTRCRRTSSGSPAFIVTPCTVAPRHLCHCSDWQSVRCPLPRSRAIESESEGSSSLRSSAEPTTPWLLLRGQESKFSVRVEPCTRNICPGSWYIVPKPISEKHALAFDKYASAASSRGGEASWASSASNQHDKSRRRSSSDKSRPSRHSRRTSTNRLTRSGISRMRLIETASPSESESVAA